MAWGKLKNKTLTSAGDNITTDAFGSRKFITWLCHRLTGAGDQSGFYRFNSDTASVYAERRSSNGGADSTAVSQTRIQNDASSITDNFCISYGINILGEEKLSLFFNINGNTAGAGNAPIRHEGVGKYVPSPDANITSITQLVTTGNNIPIDSNLSALGSN